ncbi:right-handed parallel beta-helix repeat-containing protein [Prosthecobacter sp.]|uniref:right-handed parallel beta-helix repeat-containing protein n=1 Tax=Prosthecobacter sp. TaxID=1965333 RepID=UPI002ABAE068|nr:right-handed parallel beta-helix repeat-containing protein [Prosthecobacter sp.]MDZ4403414.1 right-handed parallel beta-helix repeat-containing protein [Prosthecobacter sp.]
MKQIIFLTTLLLFNAALASAAGPTEQGKPLASASGFELRVPAPGPDAIADSILQEAIDKVASAGGGVVLLGAGDFKLSRHADDETVIIKSNITLRGQGHATHIYLDPKTPPNDLRYFPVRIGSATVPAHNVVIEHLRYTGNDKAIGGGSIMGFNARLDEKESLLLSCDNITVRHCWIYDAKQAAGCTKAATAMYLAKYVIPAEEAKEAAVDPEKVRTGYFDADRMATQFKNWQVYNNYIETCGNKAVELAECNGGLIADNHIVNVVDGPQVIFGSRNVQIRDNIVHFTRTGINITEGSHHIRVSGNHVEPMPEVSKKAVLPCLIFRTEPLPLRSTISDVVVTGNIFRNQHTHGKCTVRFVTRPEALSCVYEGIAVSGNVFDGDVQFCDVRTSGRTTIRDIVFADNVCEGALLSEPQETMASSHVVVRGNMLRQAGNMMLKASNWIWSSNTHVNGTLEIAPGARYNIIRDNVTAAPVTDKGTDTVLTGNVVMKKTEAP